MLTFCRHFFFLIILNFFCGNSLAISPEKYLSEAEEQRARELFLQINCPVCAGQTIESSDTEIAFQLRKLVRQQISDGKKDEEIKDYLVEKYGANILNSVVASKENILLWILPLMFLFLGLLFWYRRKN